MGLFDLVSNIGGGQALQDAASQAGVSPDVAQSILGEVMQHAADGGGAEGMVEAVAGKAGVDPSVVQQFLPMVMPLLQGHADANPDAAGGLGGILGSLGGLFGGQ